MKYQSLDFSRHSGKYDENDFFLLDNRYCFEIHCYLDTGAALFDTGNTYYIPKFVASDCNINFSNLVMNILFMNHRF